MTKEIQLTQGQVAIVDDEDFEYLSKRKWCMEGHGYTHANNGEKNIKMHRLIMDAQQGQIVDHINGDRLDNRKSNLRFCTKSENTQNKHCPSKSRSGYYGIYKRDYGKWTARLCVNGKAIAVGASYSPEEAARMYDKAARLHYGVNAMVNFPNEN